MQQQGTHKENSASGAVTVLPTDTLLWALRLMERHRIRLLAVVEETGALVGVISEAHILQAWTAGPLQPVCEVMAACGQPGEKGEEGVEWYHVEAWARRAQAYGS